MLCLSFSFNSSWTLGKFCLPSLKLHSTTFTVYYYPNALVDLFTFICFMIILDKHHVSKERQLQVLFFFFLYWTMLSFFLLHYLIISLCFFSLSTYFRYKMITGNQHFGYFFRKISWKSWLLIWKLVACIAILISAWRLWYRVTFCGAFYVAFSDRHSSCIESKE